MPVRKGLQACAFAMLLTATSAADITFSREVAPIIFQHCTHCHRPNQAGPFDFLTYSDVKKRARDIERVTTKRIMPPWLPEHGYGEFQGERRLTDEQIATLKNWVDQGAPEGTPSETPPPPKFESQWQLGEPDLIVEPSEAFPLPAGGKDIYYNFVTPIPLSTKKFVSAVELLPGSRAVHHAFITFDSTPTSRRKGAKAHPPGFVGMNLPETASMPEGELLSWQPGKTHRFSAPGLSWILSTNTDLVLQTHLNPQGKEEKVRPKVGFHFTNEAPTNRTFRLGLNTWTLDIPPGESNYIAEATYTLPVDLTFLRVGAHAHYLGKEMQAFALLPSGEKKWLLWIKDWDIKWQGDYEYKTPFEIPKGSKIVMHFTYDNSTNNVRNPFSPPRRTYWGGETTDEMGQLYFQTLPRNLADFKILADDSLKDSARVSIDFYRFRLKRNPDDDDAHLQLGRALESLGQVPEAITHLQEAARLSPTNDLPHFDLGAIFLRQGRTRRAFQEFTTVIRLNPDDDQAHNKLGILNLQEGRPEEAKWHFMKALQINPGDVSSAQNLARLR